MILSCQNISKAFLENQVLKNISFHVEDYEKTAIVGINGAGKTTLLRILLGEMTPDEGTVVLAKDKKVGYLAQNVSVDSERTIYDELLSVKQELIHLEEKIRECEINMKHVEGEELEALMKQYASYTHAFEQNNGYAYKSELTGVLKGLGFTEEDFNKQISTLSGGQKRRCEIAAALMHTPEILFLDEPTTGLDPATRVDVWNTIEQLQKTEKMTVFLTTHYMEEAAKADKIIIMDRGKIVTTGTPFELKEAYAADKVKLFYENGEEKEIAVTSTLEALPIIEKVRNEISGFEVIQGNMDDVFLNAIGRELTENEKTNE